MSQKLQVKANDSTVIAPTQTGTRGKAAVHPLEEMQTLYGNRAVNRLLEEQGTEQPTGLPIQRMREEIPEAEEMPNPVQRMPVGVGRKAVGMGTDEVGMRGVKRENRTGLPDQLKSGIEHLSGYSMDDVRVHYNSPKPAELNALAYTQGTEIHVAPGQEEHLPHEAWHVVQQIQGRVKPQLKVRGLWLNNDFSLEQEADTKGALVWGSRSGLGRDNPTEECNGISRRSVENSKPLYKECSRFALNYLCYHPLKLEKSILLMHS